MGARADAIETHDDAGSEVHVQVFIGRCSGRRSRLQEVLGHGRQVQLLVHMRDAEEESLAEVVQVARAALEVVGLGAAEAAHHGLALGDGVFRLPAARAGVQRTAQVAALALALVRLREALVVVELATAAQFASLQAGLECEVFALEAALDSVLAVGAGEGAQQTQLVLLHADALEMEGAEAAASAADELPSRLTHCADHLMVVAIVGTLELDHRLSSWLSESRRELE